VHADAGIREPGDLTGKRTGVGEYQQSAALWSRGVVEHDFGVSQFSVGWSNFPMPSGISSLASKASLYSAQRDRGAAHHAGPLHRLSALRVGLL
jgi:hypothetical protein